MKTWIAFWSILKKDIKNYYIKGSNISWGIIFPLSWTLMQLIQSQGSADIKELLPGLISMSVLFGTTSMLAVTITFERKSRSFERLLFAPVSINLLVVAKLSGALLFGIMSAVSPIVIAAFLTDLSGINWGVIALSVIFTALTSVFIGLLISMSAKEVFQAQMYSNFFRFPMIFLCGLFYPLTAMPVGIRWIAYCFPVTYGTDMIKTAVLNSGVLNPWISLLILCGFAAALFTVSQFGVRRRWIK